MPNSRISRRTSTSPATAHSRALHQHRRHWHHRHPNPTLIPEASTLKGRLAPSAVVTEGGEKIGLVGVTTQLLEAISSPNGTEVKGFPTGPGANGEVDNMDQLVTVLQPIINELIAEGVNKIVLMSHLQQIANEQLLATKLSGVDIILAAGSNTRLGDTDDEAVAFPGHAATFANTYPIVTQGLDGKTTVIVNTDGEYTYLGRLVVGFDADGDVIVDTLHDNRSINGAYASTAENVAEAWATTVGNLETTAFADGTKGDKVRDITQAVDAVIAAKDGNLFGFTDVYLEGERALIRSQETNLGSLSADTGSTPSRKPWVRPPPASSSSACATAAAFAPRSAASTTKATRSHPSPTPMPSSPPVACRSSTSRIRCASTTS